VITVSVS